MRSRIRSSCILLKIYIKPQHTIGKGEPLFCCILLKIYIKPQQSAPLSYFLCRCILLKIYIKPQQNEQVVIDDKVVSY